jgi:hypothetical protein
MAVEDELVLADRLIEPPSVETAASANQARRVPRVHRVLARMTPQLQPPAWGG